jgi:hypothetical protein
MIDSHEARERWTYENRKPQKHNHITLPSHYDLHLRRDEICTERCKIMVYDETCHHQESEKASGTYVYRRNEPLAARFSCRTD